MLKLTAIKNKGELKKGTRYTLGGILQKNKKLVFMEVDEAYDSFDCFGYPADEVKDAMLGGVNELPSLQSMN